MILLYNLVESDKVPDQAQHDKFKDKIRKIVYTEYPIYKKLKAPEADSNASSIKVESDQ